jgi:hypothetical protein
MGNVESWEISTPCNSCKSRCFGGTYRPYLQDARLLVLFFSIEDEPNKGRGGEPRTMEVPLQERLFTACCKHILTANQEESFNMKMRRYVPPKRVFLQGSHGVVISQKTAFFAVITLLTPLFSFVIFTYLQTLQHSRECTKAENYRIRRVLVSQGVTKLRSLLA